VNEDGSSSLEIEYEHNGKDAEGPKHGKVDPENTPHFGGNTWAGGSGGRDTAGLGGKGGAEFDAHAHAHAHRMLTYVYRHIAGAYRSDSGHEVHQLTEAEKESVSAEVKAAAKEMAKVRACSLSLDSKLDTKSARETESTREEAEGNQYDRRRPAALLELLAGCLATGS
jgi:hypothetical protein